MFVKHTAEMQISGLVGPKEDGESYIAKGVTRRGKVHENRKQEMEDEIMERDRWSW